MRRERMSVRQWAADRGVSSSTAGRAALAGRIQRGPDGLVDGGQADHDFEQNRIPRADSPTPRAGRGRGNGVARGTAGRPRSPANASLAAEQAALVRARRESIEFDMEIKRGEWLRADEVMARWYQELQRLRDRLLIIPHRIAHELHQVDATVVQQRLNHELREALNALAQPEGRQA